ncbi:oligosaccharide repeat unit polymerase [Aeromonas rivipollensis]
MNLNSNGLKKNRTVYLSLYIFSNIYFTVYYSFSGRLGGDFAGNYPAVPESLSMALFLILMCWGAYVLIFKSFEVMSTYNVATVNSKRLDVIFFALALTHLNGLVNGYISPSSDVERSVFYLMFNYLLSVDTLLLIYLFYCIKFRSILYYINLVITIIIYLYSGRTGIFIYLLALINLVAFYDKGRVNLRLNFILIVIAFSLFPFVRSLKHYMLLTVISDEYRNMSFFDGFIAFWGKSDFYVTYVKYFNETVERFQQVSNLSFIFDNADRVNMFLSGYDFSLFYPATKRIFENLIGLPNTPYQFYKLIGSYVSGGETLDWNVPVGLPGLVVLDNVSFVLYFLISISLLFVAIILSRAVDRNGAILELTFISMVIFIFHGWINDFMSYTMSLFVFFTLILLIKPSRRVANNKKS